MRRPLSDKRPIGPVAQLGNRCRMNFTVAVNGANNLTSLQVERLLTDREDFSFSIDEVKINRGPGTKGATLVTVVFREGVTRLSNKHEDEMIEAITDVMDGEFAGEYVWGIER